MALIYGLVVILVISEGIIIQCEGTKGADQTNQKEDAQNIDTEVALPFLPVEVQDLIFREIDLETLEKAARELIIRTTNYAMSKITQGHTIEIASCEEMKNILEIKCNGELSLRIHNYERCLRFFERFDDQLKKIAIMYSSTDEHNKHKEINENIIKKYAKNFEELLIAANNDEGFWEEVSEEGKDIQFPEVKKFSLHDDSRRNKFDLNSIFPKLEIVKLYKDVADGNCLANVKTLKELMLRTSWIQDHQLKHIFANNRNIEKLSLLEPNSTETMHLIAEYLTELKELLVEWPEKNFFVPASNEELYQLRSVNHFHIIYKDIKKVTQGISYYSFHMPNLKKLTIEGDQVNGIIILFIRLFEKLEKLELFVMKNDVVKCFKALTHIKEITTDIFGDDFVTLETIFKSVDNDSNLQTLKLKSWPRVGESFYKTYENPMKNINFELKKIDKPTWTASHEERIDTGRIYMVFTRDPST